MLDRNSLLHQAKAFALALVAWKEGSNQTLAARAGIMHTVLTRAANPRWWGNDVWQVIGKKEQYSALGHPGDANLVRWPQLDEPPKGSFLECLALAWQVLDGTTPNPAPGATHYHDVSLPHPPPAWGPNPERVATVDDLTFYVVD